MFITTFKEAFVMILLLGVSLGFGIGIGFVLNHFFGNALM